jgi:hypothetical protein
LSQQYKVVTHPNPFGNATQVTYDLPLDSKVVISIYDVMGRRVAQLVNKELKAGSYTIDFDAARFEKGIYYYKMDAQAKEKLTVLTGKLIRQ